MAGLFALQATYGAFFCDVDGVKFLEATSILAVVPMFLLIVSGSIPAMVACAVLIPFTLIANAAECTPSQGGGAAMGYVPAFLFGMPLALFAGGAVAVANFLLRRRRASHDG